MFLFLLLFLVCFTAGCDHFTLHPERRSAEDRRKERITQEEPVAQPEALEEPEGERAEPAGEMMPEEEPVTEDVAEPETEEEQREVLDQYDAFLQINPYIAGWLKIDDSVIDDPVVYTPLSQNYFLHRDIDGSDTSKGTLFIAVDWQEGYHNTLVYGHNMKDGSAFGSLQKFEDASYGMAHRILHFSTLYEESDYELYAAFYSQIDEEELETEDDRENADNYIASEAIRRKEAGGETVAPEELTLFDIDLHTDFGGEDIYRQEKDEDNGRFRYYYYTNLSDRNDFEYYAKNVKERALYDTGIEAEWGDDFITLSTCSYQVKNGRFVVVGIRKNHEE